MYNFLLDIEVVLHLHTHLFYLIFLLDKNCFTVKGEVPQLFKISLLIIGNSPHTEKKFLCSSGGALSSPTK